LAVNGLDKGFPPLRAAKRQAGSLSWHNTKGNHMKYGIRKSEKQPEIVKE
jgi:hypothetical protein